MRVLVTGGRDYDDRERAFAILDGIHAETPITLIIQGGATGADALAKAWAEARHILEEQYNAAWDDLDAIPLLMRFKNGKPYNAAAGAARNARMLEEGHPDLVLAFPGGKGTLDMLTRAYKAQRGPRPELLILEIT